MKKKTPAPRQPQSAPLPSTRRPGRRPHAPRSFGGVPSDAAVLAAARWSFDGVLRRVLGFSRAAELESEARRPPHVGQRGSERRATSPALDALTLFVRTLNAPTQGKLRALMRAGREAQTLPTAIAALAAEQPPGSAALPELFAQGATGLQDLQRGHAVACATGFNLELELERWSEVAEPESLEERVWSRFGRELAKSRVDEWACFAVVDERDRLLKLYLRRGKARWWSFAGLIDRPSERALDVPRAAGARRTRIVVLPLQAALGRSCRPELRAVRRASLALSARLGNCRAPFRAAATAPRQVAR